MDIYGNGFHFANKDEIDKKVNISQPAFKRLTNFNQWSDLIGESDTTGKNGILSSFRDDTNWNSQFTSGGNGAGIVFGGYDTHAMITAMWNKPIVTITAGNLPNPTWSEKLAFQSDINALKARISALEKQIGGVLSSALNHLFSSRKVVF